MATVFPLYGNVVAIFMSFILYFKAILFFSSLLGNNNQIFIIKSSDYSEQMLTHSAISVYQLVIFNSSSVDSVDSHSCFVISVGFPVSICLRSKLFFAISLSCFKSLTESVQSFTLVRIGFIAKRVISAISDMISSIVLSILAHFSLCAVSCGKSFIISCIVSAETSHSVHSSCFAIS